MEGNRVYLAACPDYGQAEAKLREAVAALGGMERFVRRRSWWRRRGARR